ncbi:magnesium/cobalt transporter CorA [Patescibacteria group bacterium]
MPKDSLMQKFNIAGIFNWPTKKSEVPGTVKYVGKKREEPVKIHIIDYNAGSYTEKKLDTIVANLPFVKDDSITWINITGVHDEEIIKRIGKIFGISSLVLEDIANTTQRPKLEEFPDYLFMVLKMAYPEKGTDSTAVEQVSLLVSENYVISFQEREEDVLEILRERIRKGEGEIRDRGSDYLAYLILDVIVDNYFPVMEDIGEQIESLEEKLLKSADRKLLNEIYRMKQKIVIMRQAIWPMRDLVHNLEKSKHQLISDRTREFLSDAYDHTLQISEAVEIFRDMVSGMLDLYLSTSSNRMNEVMKVLTMFAAIFIPLTFIAGIYGMNFRSLPGLQSDWGILGVFGSMAALVIVMIIYFKAKKWL